MVRNSISPDLAGQLRDAIRQSTQSFNQLSIACGVDRGRLSRFVRGERDLTLSAAAKLCEVLGLSLCKGGGGQATPLPPLPGGAKEVKKPRGKPRKGS